MNELLKNDFFKSNIFSVVSDRTCPAIEKADRHNIPTHIFHEPSKLRFSSRLLEYLVSNDVDYVISFFTKLFVGDLLEVYQDRIVNVHPSLLPAFKGLNAFDDAIDYGTRYLGSTIHFIDRNMDEGKIIMQTALPLDTTKDVVELRHSIFVQQCKALVQVVRWLAEGRISIDGQKVTIANARFDDFEYAPALDFEDAARLDVPYQGSI